MSIYLGTQRLATNIAGDTSTSLPLAGGTLTGNLAFANEGDGITFAPHMGAGTLVSSTLDDYEDGTWTPTASLGSVGAVDNARYIRVGGLVHVQVDFFVSSVFSSGANRVTITGLPFSADAITSINFTNINTGDPVVIDHNVGLSSIFIQFSEAATSIGFYLNGTYDTDD